VHPLWNLLHTLVLHSHGSVFSAPIWDPDAKGVYYGLDFSKKKGHLIRAAMEGTAYALKHNLEAAEEAGAKVEVLKAMGGAANSHLWTQIKSDVTSLPLKSLPPSFLSVFQALPWFLARS